MSGMAWYCIVIMYSDIGGRGGNGCHCIFCRVSRGGRRKEARKEGLLAALLDIELSKQTFRFAVN